MHWSLVPVETSGSLQLADSLLLFASTLVRRALFAGKSWITFTVTASIASTASNSLCMTFASSSKEEPFFLGPELLLVNYLG